MTKRIYRCVQNCGKNFGEKPCEIVVYCDHQAEPLFCITMGTEQDFELISKTEEA